MIEKRWKGKYPVYIPICDGCGEELSEHEEWDDALNEIKHEKWTIKKIGDEWINLCWNCEVSNENQVG